MTSFDLLGSSLTESSTMTSLIYSIAHSTAQFLTNYTTKLHKNKKAA